MVKFDKVQEKPNTKNVVVWKDPVDYKETKPVKKEKANSEESSWFYSKFLDFLEWLEFYVIFVAGAGLWAFGVHYFLKWHRFPHHMYTTEIALIVLVPILLIYLVLAVLDRLFKTKID